MPAPSRLNTGTNTVWSIFSGCGAVKYTTAATPIATAPATTMPVPHVELLVHVLHVRRRRVEHVVAGIDLGAAVVLAQDLGAIDLDLGIGRRLARAERDRDRRDLAGELGGVVLGDLLVLRQARVGFGGGG